MGLRKITLILGLIGVVFFTACARVPLADPQESNQAKSFQTPTEGNAALYIYRDSFAGKDLKKAIWVDGECIGQTSNKVFFYVPVAGNMEHKISTQSEFSPNHMNLYTESGKNYFIRQYIKLGVFIGGADLELMEEEEGKAAIYPLNMAIQGVCSDESDKPASVEYSGG